MLIATVRFCGNPSSPQSPDVTSGFADHDIVSLAPRRLVSTKMSGDHHHRAETPSGAFVMDGMGTGR